MEIETGTDTVLAEISDRVGIITLNRPRRRNALHPEMYEAVPRLIERFVDDDGVRCILLTGAGSAFCSGGDVRGSGNRPSGGETPTTVETMTASLVHDARMVVALHESPKLSIAALPGPAVGAGLSIALATDLRIAARSARLVPGWADLGFSGDFGGTWLLSRLLGPSRALAMLVDNAPISAVDALDLGLVNRVVADERLRDEAMSWAGRIAAGPATAHRYFKENVRQATHLGLVDALPLEAERMIRSGRTEEHREAVRRWIRQADARRRAKSSASG